MKILLTRYDWSRSTFGEVTEVEQVEERTFDNAEDAIRHMASHNKERNTPVDSTLPMFTVEVMETSAVNSCSDGVNRWEEYDAQIGEEGLRAIREKAMWYEMVFRDYGSLDAYWEAKEEQRRRAQDREFWWKRRRERELKAERLERLERLESEERYSVPKFQISDGKLWVDLGPREWTVIDLD